MQISIPTGSYQLPDPKASSRRLVNCFVESAPQTPQLGPNPIDSDQHAPPVVLRRAAGITKFASDGSTNPVRGLWLMQGTLYAVIGPNLYAINTKGVMTLVGTGIQGGGLVRMTDNSACLVILEPSSTNLWTYAPNDPAGPPFFKRITSIGFTALGAIDLGFIDGYIVFLELNGRGFFNSDNQVISGQGAITFTNPAVFPREFGTDNFVGMSISHRIITMYGTNTSEMYVDVGAAIGSPFASAPDNFIELGCAAGLAIAKQDQTPIWLATDRTVRRGVGITPVKISNFGIEAILNSANLTGAFAFATSYAGHLFWCLTLPNSSRTLVYDITTGEWHELSTFGIGYWRPLCSLQAYGLQFVGDSQSGTVGYLDVTSFTDLTAPMTASWTTQAVYNENNRLSHRRLELMLGSGFV